ncbi:hypothetical protein OSB04_003265 [Centaurea solstitialis]|uniref:Uncharacterized protein n=1 Tax=Centaurea solstitialis TaxID=347529 RepID=A0AA38TUT5_9ASTR|nr:hypothetical protein OSB04_003265 [Centaurea solstitialis]
MEDTLKDQTSTVSESKGGKSSKLLRYPLRSASKSKEDKLPASSPSIASASASRRGKPTSSVSQSVSVLDMSAKEKSAKPPRRLSIPTNQMPVLTPISEARATRSGNLKSNGGTPGSDVARSLNRRKFTVLSSASYWLSHIKLSEAAAKHNLSLGFLSLRWRLGNLQLLRDELKSYAGRHNLLDLGESAKDVFQSYEIPESIEQFQVSETCSEVLEDGSRSLDDDARSLSSATGVPKSKPKSLNNGASSAAKESARETTQKGNPVHRIKAPVNKKMANQSPALGTGMANCKRTPRSQQTRIHQRETEGQD